MKSIIKKMLANAGVELRRTRPAIGGFPSDPFNAQKEFMDKLSIMEPVIFDVGAHKGETVKHYRTMFPEAKIFCFEPFAANASILRDRFSDDPSIHVFEQAVTDLCGEKSFYINNMDATNSLLPREKNSRRYFSRQADSKTVEKVEAVTIDEIMRQQNIDNIDILKFDIQGGELMALQGAEQALQNKAISVIYTEVLFVPHYENNPLLLDIWRYLEQFDYSFFDIYDLYRAGNGQLRFADVMFISKDTRSNVVDCYKAEP